MQQGHTITAVVEKYIRVKPEHRIATRLEIPGVLKVELFRALVNPLPVRTYVQNVAVEV